DYYCGSWDYNLRAVLF
nr:immunoglobulin light chain junction region [Macaca mulatta]